MRRKDGEDVVIMGFSMGKAWLNGVSYEPTELRSHLFLGPLRPSDFEQLTRLREALEVAEERLADNERWWAEASTLSTPTMLEKTPTPFEKQAYRSRAQMTQSALDKVREALTQRAKGGES